MTNTHNDARLHSSRTTAEQRRHSRTSWIVVATTLTVAVFAEAAFAGAMLSGIGWGLTLHKATAGALIASTLLASLVAVVTLRRVPNGMRLASTFAALAVTLCLQ